MKVTVDNFRRAETDTYFALHTVEAGGVGRFKHIYQPVNPEYKPPFAFTGTLRRVIVDVSGEHVTDYEEEMKVVLMKQ
jgi:hypothetical protein